MSLVRRRPLDVRQPRLARLARRMVALALAYAVATCLRGPLPTPPALAGVVSVRVVAKAWRALPGAPVDRVDRVEALQEEPAKARAGRLASALARGVPPATLAAAPPVVASAVQLGQLSFPSAAAPGDRAPPAASRARGPPRAGALGEPLFTRG